jgi:hypothetical protein
MYEKGKGKEKAYLRQREYRKEHREHFNELDRKRYDPQKRHDKHLRVYHKRVRIKPEPQPRETPSDIRERFVKKWEERVKQKERQEMLKKIRTETTYEKDGKLFYNFYIIRRLREFRYANSPE